MDARRRRKADDQSRLTRWIAAFGDQVAATISPRQVERILTDLQTEGKQPATLIRYLTVLKAILNRGTRLGLLRNNLATSVQTPMVNNILVRYLTPLQEGSLFDVLPKRFRPIVQTALHTGLRKGELLRLTWADVDWHVGVLTIHETKAGQRHRVPMNSLVLGTLTEMRCETNPDPGDRVFPFETRHLGRVFQRAVQTAGLVPFRFHDLRHTFASRLAMRGENDRTIMALGGWKSTRMLARYAHLSPTHLWNAIEGLTQMGTGSKTGSADAMPAQPKAEAIQNIGAGNGI